MGGGGGPKARRTGPVRVPALGETLLRTMMIGSAGAVTAARDRGAFVVTPATMGVGLLEFHQFDRMVRAGRLAARALLDQAGPDLGGRVLVDPAAATGDEADSPPPGAGHSDDVTPPPRMPPALIR